MKIAIVAGETSGDILAAGLISALKKKYPQAEFMGIAGPLMQDQGMVSVADMQKLSIMGLDGLLGSIGEILSIRKNLLETLLADPPDIFIGVDAPDFNLTLEEKLRQQGILTVHYVSPTVWAWRSYRIHKIRRAVDLMLTLFPFEADFYKQHKVPVKFVGHPIAQSVKPHDCDPEFRERYADQEQTLLAVLPGSRSSEIKRLGGLFLDVMRSLYQKDHSLRFIVPLVNERIHEQFEVFIQPEDHEFLYLVGGEQSRTAMSAADIVLLASGTAALEAALLAKPTVVAYKLSWLTYWFAKATTAVKHASMPNHLLPEPIVPEFIQQQATVENLVAALQTYLKDAGLRTKTSQQLATIHAKLDYDADQLAADAIVELLEKTPEL
ncbi:MAG: lipid-A-disaccharide synthase [Arenicella sp.]